MNGELEKLMLARTLIFANGTTAIAALLSLCDEVKNRIGLWPAFWPALLVETIGVLHEEMQAAWTPLPLAEDLAALYPQRHELQIPEHLRNLDERYWVDTDKGGAGMPATAAIAMALKYDEMRNWLSGAMTEFAASHGFLSAMQSITDQHEGAVLRTERPFATFLTAAGGSTGHAATLAGMDAVLQEYPGVDCCVWVLGPSAAGNIHGDEVAHANTVRLFTSLEERFLNWPGRVWVLWVDGEPNRYSAMVRDTGRFLYDFLATGWGSDMQRRLADSFRAAGRSNVSGFHSFVCRVDIARKAVDAEEVRRIRAMKLLGDLLQSPGTTV